MPVYRVFRFAVAIAAVLIGAAERPAAQDPAAAAVTYARDIRPILETHCTVCHAAGGSAPMALTSYDEVRPWARQITEKALSRQMPKWHAARGFGAFANDPTLSPFELAQLAAWAAEGAPPGTGNDATHRRVVRPSTAGTAIPADASDADLRVRSGWITGWTFTPGDSLITSATFTSRDGTPIGTWVAGDRPLTLPANGAIKIAGPIHVHLQRRRALNDERPPAAVASRMRFSPWPRPRADTPAPRPRRVWTEHVRCGSFMQAADAQAIAIRPALPSGGSAQIVFERLAGAPPALAGWFRDFDLLYPRTYWFEMPIDLTGGARVSGDGPCEADVLLTGRPPSGRR
jgi:mono/diheme cytochrome c family protein